MDGRSLLLLSLAIAAEVIGTSALKASDGFTKIGPAALTVAGYAAAFVLMSQTMRAVPVATVYAIWSGAGIVLITAAGYALFGERPDAAALVGLGLIVAGVLVLNFLSGSVRHGG